MVVIRPTRFPLPGVAQGLQRLNAAGGMGC